MLEDKHPLCEIRSMKRNPTLPGLHAGVRKLPFGRVGFRLTGDLERRN